MTPRSPRRFLPALAVVLLLCAGCDRFPQDPQHSLEQILQRGTLRVGVTESRPWIVGQPPGKANGLEGRLLADFADELGVDVQWHWGSAENHFEALKRYELDVVAGGLTRANPWRKHVGFSIAYYTSEVVIGVPPSESESSSEPLLSDLTGVTVAMRPASGLRRMLEERGATVIVRGKLDTVQGPIAAEAWAIEGMGFRKTNIRLQKHRHVLAVPRGENALLMRLESLLLRRSQTGSMDAILWEASKQ